MISSRLRPFGTTIFSEMTRLALEHDAINLAQGFPDFEGPDEIREAAVTALRSGENQYSRSLGHPALVGSIARSVERQYGLPYDPDTEVIVTNGATEGIAAALLGLLDEGDEVILFEPFYDSYHGGVRLAGARPRFCTLRAPDWGLDLDELRGLFSARTKLLILNTPHNPTGKVFSAEELDAIGGLCQEHDVLVLSDEVYEHITFDDVPHVPMATRPGMRDRTLTLSSSGKTFSYTGWKIGWGTGPAPLVAAAQAAHQFLTFCASTPLQCAIAHALENVPLTYYSALRDGYRAARDLLVDALRSAGFRPYSPAGTYFVLADFSELSDEDDRAFAVRLTRDHGVAAVPPSVFYEKHPEEGRRLLRFSFSKKPETLRTAAERLRAIAR